MENNQIEQDKPLATQIEIAEKRKCRCCGKTLPITYFKQYGRGYSKTCMACERNESGVSEKFKDFTARELIEELISRGYKGQLKYVKVETFNL